jgi:hypothetical protein
MVLQSSGPISMSSIRNEFGGPSTLNAISMSQYKSGGTYGANIQSNPNNIPSTNSGISASKFYSAAKWIYPTTNYQCKVVTNDAGWSMTTILKDNSSAVWTFSKAENSYSNPISNYKVTFYKIYQNATGADNTGILYSFADDNVVIYLNNNSVATYTYTGATRTLPNTSIVGQNLLKCEVTDIGGSAIFRLAVLNSSSNKVVGTDSSWVMDANTEYHYYNWYSLMTQYNASGYVGQTSFLDPDVQWRLGASQGGTYNSIYISSRLQDYTSFVMYFEVYIDSSSLADGLAFYFGSTNFGGVNESGGANAYTLSFRLFSDKGISLYNGSSLIGTYSTTGHIASAWQPVYVYYNNSNTNTLTVTWNGTQIFQYSNSFHTGIWMGYSGTYWGFMFRDGGLGGSAWVRHVHIMHR